MRARMAVHASGLTVELRDILLKDKPAAMIEASPKATVPVLILEKGSVIDESLDIVHWALAENDPENWYPATPDRRRQMEELIEENDGPFKSALDRYKYHVRFPEAGKEDYRADGEQFLAKLDSRLSENEYLFGDHPTYADICIFPFVRQFANSDRDWFDQAPYPHLHRWLEMWLTSPRFKAIMKKQPLWKENSEPVYFPDFTGSPS